MDTERSSAARLRFTDVLVRAAAPRAKPYRLTEIGGLSLLVQPNGRRCWQLRHRFFNETTSKWSERVISLGLYPAVSLREARIAREEARQLLHNGKAEQLRRRHRRTGPQPGAAPVPDASTVGALGELWIVTTAKRLNWGEKTRYQVELRFRRYIAPVLGQRAAASIVAADARAVVEPLMAGEQWATVARVHRILRDVMEFAVERGLAPANPIGKLQAPAGAVQRAAGHFASLTTPAAAAPLLRAIRGYAGGDIVRLALNLLPFVFVRPGELRHAEWKEIDFDTATWTIPAAKMKMRTDHLVPLSRQAIAILEEIRRHTGDGALVFPSARGAGRPMSENALRVALRSLGFTNDDFTPHGFRAMARTLLDEQLQVNPLWVEAQLAHRVPDPLGRAYNRATYLHDRRGMMQQWADYLDQLVSR